MNSYTRNLIIVCLLSASCAISKKENERIDQMLSEQAKPLELQIEDSLTTDLLAKFETRAIQKLQEFYDYLSLLRDDRYDQSMKEEIRYSASGLFLSSDQIIAPLVPENHSEASVDEMLMKSQQKPFLEQFEIVSIEVDQPLTQISQKVYQGELNYELKVGKASEVISYKKRATFSLRKIEKNLGGESLEVWEVFLNQIQ